MKINVPLLTGFYKELFLPALICIQILIYISDSVSVGHINCGMHMSRPYACFEDCILHGIHLLRQAKLIPSSSFPPACDLLAPDYFHYLFFVVMQSKMSQYYVTYCFH